MKTQQMPGASTAAAAAAAADADADVDAAAVGCGGGDNEVRFGAAGGVVDMAAAGDVLSECTANVFALIARACQNQMARTSAKPNACAGVPVFAGAKK